MLVIPLSVSAVGVCSLDKSFYHPGETALFSCSCTLPTEEGKTGYIVFKNSTGDILQNNSADSGLCRTSFLTDSYTFLVGQDFIGNVTFSLFGNGSGNPVNWGNVGDVTFDDFNVSDGLIVDCIISNVTSSEVNIGEVGSVKISVSDSITGNSLVHVVCQGEVYDIDSNPLLFEPYGVGETARFTGSDGVVGFQYNVNELFWIIDTTYLFEFHCHCLDNSSDEACYDKTTGYKVGFKSCTAKVPFITSSVDKRDVGSDLFPVVFSLIFISIFFLVVGFITPKLGFKVASFGVGIIELIILSFVVWINRGGNSIVSILRMNFYILLILGFGIGFIGLIFFVIRIMNVGDDLVGKDPNSDDYDKKWRGKK